MSSRPPSPPLVPLWATNGTLFSGSWRRGFSPSHLHAAAARGDEKEVIRLLYSSFYGITPVFNVNPVDQDGRTPLSWAAGYGHIAVVELLLERSDIDAGWADESGRTPLSWAAGNGHVAVVKLLLERNDVDPGLRDRLGRSPFSWAARYGRTLVIQLLITQSEVEADSRDAEGRSPLSWAAGNGHSGLVGLLITRPEVSVDSRDNNGRTPLSWAAEGGHYQAVDLLMGLGKADGYSGDKNGRIPLWWACHARHEGEITRRLCPVCGRLTFGPEGTQSDSEPWTLDLGGRDLDSEFTPTLLDKHKCSAYRLVHDLHSIWAKRRAPSKEAYGHSCDSFLQVCTDVGPWDTLANVGYAVVHPDPLGPKAASRIRKWRRTCERDHKLCGGKEEPPLPTRVLDVGVGASPEKVTLLVTNGRRGQYLALSHCWGAATSKFRTLRENIDDMKEDVPVQNAPATFRDAVRVTRMLGIRYLWIDSLCIIQDDLADWQVESAKMGRVYRHAHITIAASKAAADTEGFLGLRRAAYHAWVRVLHPSGKSATFFTRFLETDDTPKPTPPLELRGWTFQEAYLSRRRLKFLADKTVWSCEHGEWDESQRDHDEIHRLTNGVRNLLYHSNGNCYIRANEWFRIVEDYSSRQLTFDTDRFPALSGIAQIAAETRGFADSYLAGLWTHEMMRNLCWRVHDAPAPRPKQRIAPSWSWASIGGRVSYPEQHSGISYGHCRSVSQITSSHVRQVDGNQFGQVEEGAWIMLSTLVHQFSVVEPPGDTSKFLIKRRDVEVQVDLVSMDFYDEPTDNLSALILTETSYFELYGQRPLRVSGLIIRRVQDSPSSLEENRPRSPERQVFKRVGYFEAERPREMYYSLWRMDKVVLI